MRSFFGFLLLGAGLGLGLLAYQPQSIERHSQLAQVTRILTPAGRLADSSLITTGSLNSEDAATAGRTFSPRSPLFALSSTRLSSKSRADHPTTRAPRSAAIKLAKAPVKARIINQALPPIRRPSGWQSVVTYNPAAPAARKSWSTTKPDNDIKRYRLVRDIQRQLRRVGCYGGKIDGSWGPMSIYAMEAFTKQVNASLPMAEPDYILLTLIKAQTSTVCGRSCPAGKTLSARGVCLSPTIVAERRDMQLRRKKNLKLRRNKARQVAIVAPAPRRALRSTHKKPLKRSVVASRRVKPDVVVVRTPANQRVAPRIEDTRVAAVAPPSLSRKPLPGRMSVGGPSSSPPRSAQPLSSSTTSSFAPVTVVQPIAPVPKIAKRKARYKKAVRSKKRIRRKVAKTSKRSRRRKWRRHRLPREHRAMLSDAFFN